MGGSVPIPTTPLRHKAFGLGDPRAASNSQGYLFFFILLFVGFLRLSIGVARLGKAVI